MIVLKSLGRLHSGDCLAHIGQASGTPVRIERVLRNCGRRSMSVFQCLDESLVGALAGHVASLIFLFDFGCRNSHRKPASSP